MGGLCRSEVTTFEWWDVTDAREAAGLLVAVRFLISVRAFISDFQ